MMMTEFRSQDKIAEPERANTLLFGNVTTIDFICSLVRFWCKEANNSKFSNMPKYELLLPYTEQQLTNFEIDQNGFVSYEIIFKQKESAKSEKIQNIVRRGKVHKKTIELEIFTLKK